MENLDRQSGLAPNADRFIERIHFGCALAAQMAGVDASILSGHFGEFD